MADRAADARAELRLTLRRCLEALGIALYRTGWLAAKVLLAVLTAIGAVFWGVGWLGRRAVWPALVWMGAAVRLGWDDARPPREQRGKR